MTTTLTDSDTRALKGHEAARLLRDLLRRGYQAGEMASYIRDDDELSPEERLQRLEEVVDVMHDDVCNIGDSAFRAGITDERREPPATDGGTR